MGARGDNNIMSKIKYLFFFLLPNLKWPITVSADPMQDIIKHSPFFVANYKDFKQSYVGLVFSAILVLYNLCWDWDKIYRIQI